MSAAIPGPFTTNSLAASASIPRPSGPSKPLIPDWLGPVLKNSAKIAAGGAVSGALLDVLAQPIFYASNVLASLGPKPDLSYPTTREVLLNSYKKNGVKGLFPGLLPVLITSPMGVAGLIAGMSATQEAYKQSSFKKVLEDKIGERTASALVNFASGYVGQATGGLMAFVPSSVISEALQRELQRRMKEAERKNPASPAPVKVRVSEIMRIIYRQDGLLGFYKGLGAQTLSFGTVHALAQPIYRFAQKELDSLGYQGFWWNVLACSIGYVSATTVSYPLNLGKVRLQVASLDERYRGKSLMTLLTEAYKNEGGVRGLYQGCLPRNGFMVTRLAFGLPAAEKMGEWMHSAFQK